ncbi:uncharacterized protein LOC133312868 [Gastrolobium bilobum]|uniref:uncharacterized protein LOC133312868 n=1 Tax=Gastrolobium bilobum TaxID=150636 RepID=UPI002AB15349|nr:uncharacterized protein LOC133312868 [Gastrolobium bilobum]
MAMKIQVIPTLFSNSPATLYTQKLKTRISCTGGNGISDAALASEFAAKATRINTHLVQAEEAMRKSRKILFGVLSEYLGLKEDEVKQKWSKMDEEEKWVLVKGFVAEWGSHFHPLSARSTKELVEDYLRQGNPPPNSPPPPSPSVLFPGLKRIIGF